MTNGFEFGVGLVNLVLLLFLLKVIVLDPLKNVAREREAKARSDMEAAERLLREATAHRERYQALLVGLEAEKQGIEETGLRDAERVAARVAEEAEREAAHTVSRAQGEARSERDAAVAGLRAQVAEATVTRARRLLEGGLDAPARQDILDNFLAKVGSADA